MNRELLLPTRGRPRRRALKASVAIMATLGLTGALAIPIVAQGIEDRQGNIPVAIDAINDPSFFTGDVLVDVHAPLAVFGASGKDVAIDGRPAGMLDGASAEEEADSGNENSALLAGQVGELGVLPGDLQLMHPVTTRRISSAYGWRKNPTGPGNQIHIGQDYALACGSPVYAAEAGRVIVSGWHGHSGNRVTLDHGSTVHSGYSHNSKLLVKIGDEVEQGELIALVGTTGNSTGCHLHFEVIINGRWHDPRNYLPVIPGQPNAMVDSRRLTVKSNTPPGGNGGHQSGTPQPSQDPDVVTPRDDTPVVPKPKPTPVPVPSPTSPTESAPADPGPSTSPTVPTPSDPDPSDGQSTPPPDISGPGPDDEPSSEPTGSQDGTGPASEGPPQDSASPSGSVSPSREADADPSGNPTGQQEEHTSAHPQTTPDPSLEPSSSRSAGSAAPSLSPSATTALGQFAWRAGTTRR